MKLMFETMCHIVPINRSPSYYLTVRTKLRLSYVVVGLHPPYGTSCVVGSLEEPSDVTDESEYYRRLRPHLAQTQTVVNS